MIYQIKKPLMIVGFILSFVLSPSVLAADEITPASEAPSQIGAITPPNSIDGLSLPENAQSTIIPTSKATDVRVIIDISGSMKQNDPDNLRIPALNLIVEMIPQGARAGVWTFGQWVNMLIPPATVDAKWRENAKQSAKEINSYGLRTNIGQAMEQATWQFERDGEYEQHTILLTDGLVDIAADNDPQQQTKNAAERQRIITEILKQYKDLGVKIHSIGLSNNADKVLLDKLALETDGSSVIVNSPEELVKAFLKAFEKAAPEVAEQVPLSNDNTFDIDTSVEEFTALVFRKKGTPALQLTSPSGVVISQIKSIENARWFGESVYDLVTITQPEAGTWKIEADLDPDNRVTVVSDLKMEIQNLPNSLFPGQQVDFEVYLHEDGKVINNPDFLKLMTFEMTMTAESGRSGTKVISDPDNLPKDGRYKESISRLSKEGQYELKIEVDGKTFKRMRKDYIQVRQPIGFEIRKTESGKNQSYSVRVIPQVADVEVAKTRVIAKLKGPDQSSIIQAMPWVEEGVWEAVISPDKGPGEYEITMNIKGSLGENQEFRVKPDPIKLMFPIPADFTHEYLTQSEEAVKTEEAPKQAEKLEEKPIEEVTPVAQEEPPVEEVSPEVQEPVMPNLEDKMKSQEQAEQEKAAEEAPEEAPVEQAVADEPEEVLEPIPYWLYAAIPIGVLLFGVGGFFVYRKIMNKKLASTQNDAPKESLDKPDVALNDGLDDEDFDEDFDLSGDDDDEMAINMGSEDESQDTSASDDLDGLDDLDDMGMDEPEPEVSAQPVADDIPDFDENFDVDNNPQADDSTIDETASAIDELDSVLDGLTDEDEENIPQLDETISDDQSEISGEDLAAEESMAEFDLSNESDAQTEPEMEEEDDNSIDAALANLESELDDIDVDALIDEDKKE
ncbi:VWA domain-containing protein [Bermanella sp. WJH001]|uniref:VWA domain-containing protein n=1 Tax=Bermanella sp. WJH001 TaxID=3048005 RepID=UPI0024BEC2C4|nr:VWA domain-containing protein [Bermanella sp. WJH001]MDJ1537677.1 VWA domain-containing protein [Bermanella sp. WJH001]